MIKLILSLFVLLASASASAQTIISEDAPEMLATPAPLAKPATPTATPAATPAAQPTPSSTPESATQRASNPITSTQALQFLVDGNARFASKQNSTSSDSKPAVRAVVLACSEASTAPELVFDQSLGEIASVRIVGPALDAHVIKSLEQAVETYDAHLLIVLGHTRCSAHADRGNPDVAAALSADAIARDLPDKSELIAKRVKAGQLTIKSALYWTDSGKVKMY